MLAGALVGTGSAAPTTSARTHTDCTHLERDCAKVSGVGGVPTTCQPSAGKIRWPQTVSER